ncbi:MAG: hypothetical protein GXO24_00155 [Chlorobi bacterium]|nr:hypothetical protein [Chlorobiota bacterium]
MLLFFFLDKKEPKNQGKNMLPCALSRQTAGPHFCQANALIRLAADLGYSLRKTNLPFSKSVFLWHTANYIKTTLV